MMAIMSCNCSVIRVEFEIIRMRRCVSVIIIIGVDKILRNHLLPSHTIYRWNEVSQGKHASSYEAEMRVWNAVNVRTNEPSV